MKNWHPLSRTATLLLTVPIYWSSAPSQDAAPPGRQAGVFIPSPHIRSSEWTYFDVDGHDHREIARQVTTRLAQTPASGGGEGIRLVLLETAQPQPAPWTDTRIPPGGGEPVTTEAWRAPRFSSTLQLPGHLRGLADIVAFVREEVPTIEVVVHAPYLFLIERNLLDSGTWPLNGRASLWAGQDGTVTVGRIESHFMAMTLGPSVLPVGVDRDEAIAIDEDTPTRVLAAQLVSRVPFVQGTSETHMHAFGFQGTPRQTTSFALSVVLLSRAPRGTGSQVAGADSASDPISVTPVLPSAPGE